MTTTSLEHSIAQTLAYADIFDYPLTAGEVHRYLVGLAAPLRAVHAALEVAAAPGGWIQRDSLYYTIRGRRSLAEARRIRARSAAILWPSALNFGRRIARLPFVRMLAVTGALAVDNVAEGADIDYLIVTEPGRLWLCRGMTLLLAKLAARSGVTLCPNYLISRTERALLFPEKNIYTAHEVAQMVPLSGLDVYAELRRRNAWVLEFLPNAIGAPAVSTAAGTKQPSGGTGKKVLEAALSTPLVDWLESWEMHRKIRRLRRGRGPSPEASFSPEWCKGHYAQHEQKTLDAVAERFASLGAVPAEYRHKVRSWSQGTRTLP